jgi:hypothetical protein
MERKDAEEIIRVVDEFKLNHAVAVRREVAVRKHHSLGVAGGSGSVQDSCEIAVSERRGNWASE